MIGPEHYKLAEGDLAIATDLPQGGEAERFHLARAQVHATLALAAATAENDGELGRTVKRYTAWRDAGAIQ